MNCLVVGGNFQNKGAYLMLLAIQEQLNKHYEKPSIFVSPLVGNKKELIEQGFKLFNFPLALVGHNKRYHRNYKMGCFLSFLGLNKIFKNYDIEAFNDIDIIFDISGLAYTDQWGAQPTVNLLHFLTKIKPEKTKFIMMPQAFGPFSSDKIQKAMKEAINKSNLIFPREKVSYKHLIGLQNDEKISIAPDITLNYHPEVENPIKDESYCCIIPNIRMLTQGKVVWGSKYIDVLKTYVESILEKSSDINIYMLIYDDLGYDLEIAQKLEKMFPPSKISIVDEKNPQILKVILANSRFVISSRFHALASALSSSVPGLALGWSHKYEMILQEYDMENFFIPSPDDLKLDLTDILLDDSKLGTIKEVLIQKNNALLEENERMWKQIISN